MTKKDNIKEDIADKWIIKIGSGFGEPKDKIYPKDRLSAYLNFVPKSKKEVGEFCTKYQIIPNGLDLEKDNLLEAFTQEQTLLKEIANKIVSKVPLTDTDYEIINNRIGYIRKSITRIPATELNKVNKRLSPQTELTERIYPVDTFTHGNSTVSLWEDLVKILVKQNLSTCHNCGAFFQPISDHKRKYCDNPNCSNAYRQRKARKIKK